MADAPATIDYSNVPHSSLGDAYLSAIMVHQTPAQSQAQATAQDNALGASSGVPSHDPVSGFVSAVRGLNDRINSLVGIQPGQNVDAQVAQTAQNVASVFDPVRWLAGGAGVALIVGGIVISVHRG